ncbi:MAG: glycosyltransferase family 4 protein [Nocardioidaceae bacterium]
MRIGIVCPYSLDVPGGVQNHVKDLAEALIARGHHVSVLAPTEDDHLPPYVVGAGRAVPVPYNGSVARMSFGPVVAARVRRWIRDGDFDVLHLHEPATPSLSLLALWAAECPVVATFHSSNVRSRALSATASILRPSMEKINARIAVSEYARDTLVHHIGGEPVVIPNGLYVDRFSSALSRPEWRGDGGTVAFVGRLDEPRKGFPMIAEAFGRVAANRPGLRLLVVGGGDLEAAAARLPVDVRRQAEFLGRASDGEKARALASADVYVAPNTGGESFGIVLVEAMAAGAAVLASDLPAFRRVLDDGRLGVLFSNEDVDDLTGALSGLLDDPARRAALVAAASAGVRRYDWASVAGQIEQVYETVVLDTAEGSTP